jgi:hypothetical protein
MHFYCELAIHPAGDIEAAMPSLGIFKVSVSILGFAMVSLNNIKICDSESCITSYSTMGQHC